MSGCQEGVGEPEAVPLKGSESADFLRSSIDVLAEVMPASRVVVLEGQQHVAMDTAPQLLAEAVLSFLAED